MWCISRFWPSLQVTSVELYELLNLIAGDFQVNVSKLLTSFGNIHNQQNIGCPVYRWALAEKTTFAPHRSHSSADIIE